MDDSTFDHDHDHDDTVTPSNPLFSLTGQQTPNVSPLEQEVLDEYSRLLDNMNQLSATLATLAAGPMTTEIADGLRLLERKVTSVYTLMKASVYSIVLQQGQMEGDGEGEETMGFGGGNGGVGEYGLR